MQKQLSILGLYNYTPEVFDRMQLPEGIDKQTAIDAILLDCQELELVYPSGGYMKIAIESWSRCCVPEWSRMWKAAIAEYDPIENYDRKEEWTDSAETSGTGTSSRAAYNTDSLEVTDGSQQAGSSSGTHTGRVHGNIGVTTSAQMIAGEISIAEMANVYKQVAKSFKKRFCITVY